MSVALVPNVAFCRDTQDDTSTEPRTTWSGDKKRLAAAIRPLLIVNRQTYERLSSEAWMYIIHVFPAVLISGAVYSVTARTSFLGAPPGELQQRVSW